MPIERILLIVGFLAALGLFVFQLWRVLRTGHVRWRVQKFHRDHRPIAFALEVGACVLGILVFGGVLIASLLR